MVATRFHDMLYIALAVQQALPVLSEARPLEEAVEALIHEAEKPEPDEQTLDCYWAITLRYLCRMVEECQGGALIDLIFSRMLELECFWRCRGGGGGCPRCRPPS